MKRTIEFLLQSIGAGAVGPKAHSPHAEKVRAALDAGIFDCLAEHPGSNPPEREGRYQVLLDGWGWDIKYWMLGEWQTVKTEKILAWRELPTIVEEPK